MMLSLAPISRAIGRMKATPSAVRIRPVTTTKAIIMVKMRLALSVWPQPISLATSALPPVPSMKPVPPSTMMNGMMKFSAANGVLPT